MTHGANQVCICICNHGKQGKVRGQGTPKRRITRRGEFRGRVTQAGREYGGGGRGERGVGSAYEVKHAERERERERDSVPELSKDNIYPVFPVCRMSQGRPVPGHELQTAAEPRSRNVPKYINTSNFISEPTHLGRAHRRGQCEGYITYGPIRWTEAAKTCMWKIMYAQPARYKTYHTECNEA